MGGGALSAFNVQGTRYCAVACPFGCDHILYYPTDPILKLAHGRDTRHNIGKSSGF
jgi:hypothetical protein